ncbi:MAG: 3-oxoacyl-ACP reductase FabG [Deltaproteobacteria bacterium]|nr:3-oxoacyl-ACP reductase FabG [Deltaproteobacteria bacterium]
MDKPLALITGASRGIGRAVAIQLARDGYRVVINYLSNREAAEAVRDVIVHEGGEAVLKRFDVGDHEDANESIKELVRTEGAIPVLVNNAGISRNHLLMAMPEDDWHQVLNTDLNGVYYCTKALLRAMAGKRLPGRRIVNISSVVGERGNVGVTNYAAAKAGIVGLTKSLAREVAPLGMTANVVAPGYIDTDFIRNFAIEEWVKQIPLQRIGRPEEVASVVSFLVSAKAGYITGQVIRVDGGFLM